MLVEGCIETTTFRKEFVFWQFAGLDTFFVSAALSSELLDQPSPFLSSTKETFVSPFDGSLGIIRNE